MICEPIKLYQFVIIPRQITIIIVLSTKLLVSVGHAAAAPNDGCDSFPGGPEHLRDLDRPEGSATEY